MRIGIRMGLALRRRGVGAVSLAEASWDAPSALPAWLTLTRASIGRYADASNVLQTAAIDTARMDYDGAGASLGLLVESSRTDVLLYSEEPLTGLYFLRTTIAANVLNGWAGAASAAGLTCNAVGACYGIQGPITVSSGATITFACVLAAGTNTSPYLSIFDSAHRQAQFILSGDGSTANVNAGVTARIRKVTASLYLCSVTCTITGTLVYGTLWVSGHKSVNGTIGQSIYCDVMQLEEGAFPSSQIATTSVPVTRSADALALGGGYSSNPLIVETKSQSSGAVSRTLYNPGSGVSALANVWLRKAVVYPIGTPTPTLDAIAAGGAW